jgi:hypothetical protein
MAIYKQTIQTQSNKSNNWKVFVNNLGFQDIVMGWIWRRKYEFESLVGKDQHEWKELAKQNIIDEVLMLYQSMNKILIRLMWIKSHRNQNSVTAILLNKCDNNYSLTSIHHT